MTHEADQKPQHLSDIVPDDIFVGTSLILRQGGRFLYGVRPPRAEGSRQVIELTGIGGGMEDEDESPTAGVLREAQEEIGCGVRILPCAETIIVRSQDNVERTTLQGEECPAAVVFRYYRTPPHQPWHEDNQGEACLVVFLAELNGQPWPAMELPALMWLKPAHILETAYHDVPLSRLQSSGAELVEGEPGLLPETSWVRMTDSQEALALALGDDGLSFYRALVDAGMTKAMTSAAIFDLDGTLFTGHVWQGLFRYLRLHRRNRLSLYAFIATHAPLGFLYQMKLMDGGKMRLAWSRHMSWLLRGMSVTEGARAFTWITDEYLTPLSRPDIVALLREHRARGERVILLSGAFQPLLETIGERLGVDVNLGTQPEQREGRYTGRALEPVCQGEGKAARLRTYLTEEGSDVDLTTCSGYADSIFDLPVLEMVGHPVAVYPDEELAALAARRGWSICGQSDKTDVRSHN